MNRRDFLRPRQLADNAAQVLSVLHEVAGAGAEASADDLALLRFGRQAMATTFEVLLPFGTPDAVAAAEAALDLIDRLEDQLSVYREHSEVSRLNRYAADSPVVEERLFQLLRLAERLTAETGGAFDVTAGPLIKAWGFFRRRQQVPADDALAAARALVGMCHVALDPESRTVTFDRPGVEINLGSIGKGYALDRAAELLRQGFGIGSALLHGGHSSVYAMGRPPGDGRGWAVGIRHPWEPDRRLAVVRLHDQALGTSAATFQHLEHAGRRLGHILDPRTGWPAEGMAGASVVAPTAAEADALATAFFILGVDAAREYCACRPDVGAVLLPDGASQPVVVGLEPDALDLIPPPCEANA